MTTQLSYIVWEFEFFSKILARYEISDQENRKSLSARHCVRQPPEVHTFSSLDKLTIFIFQIVV